MPCFDVDVNFNDYYAFSSTEPTLVGGYMSLPVIYVTDNQSHKAALVWVACQAAPILCLSPKFEVIFSL